jgi:hypothetical protein
VETGKIVQETYNQISPDRQNGEKGLTGSTLKIIAITVMFIDHFAAIVLYRYLESVYPTLNVPLNTKVQILILVNYIMRLIGRLGFPIFCFLLIEGFGYTRNRRKYAGRLALFALLSEIPFDLAFNKAVLEITYQNVFFTLLVGLLTIWGLDVFLQSRKEKTTVKKDVVLQFIGAAAITAAGMAVAEVLRTDYAAVGVGTIAAMYLVRQNYHAWAGIVCAIAFAGRMLQYNSLQYENLISGLVLLVVLMGIVILCRKKKDNTRAMLAGCSVLTIAMPIEFTAYATVPMIAAYNGKRGLRLKYVFYLFYPVHILLLWLVCVVLGI